MKKLLASIFATIVAASLTACGGGGGEPAPVQVAATDTTVPANGTTTAAVTNMAFVFPTGVPSLGTTSTTTVTFTNSSTTPAFTITSGGHTASGTTTFGSCHFHVTTSDFPPEFATFLGDGATSTADPCLLTVATAGQVADGLPRSSFISLLLGTAVSLKLPVTITISPAGVLTVNTVIFGTITIRLVTG